MKTEGEVSRRDDVPARALAAVGGTRRETSVALAADHLLAVVGRSELTESRLDDSTAETVSP
jgi:hypothetical protein